MNMVAQVDLSTPNRQALMSIAQTAPLSGYERSPDKPVFCLPLSNEGAILEATEIEKEPPAIAVVAFYPNRFTLNLYGNDQKMLSELIEPLRQDIRHVIAASAIV